MNNIQHRLPPSCCPFSSIFFKLSFHTLTVDSGYPEFLITSFPFPAASGSHGKRHGNGPRTIHATERAQMLQLWCEGPLGYGLPGAYKRQACVSLESLSFVECGINWTPTAPHPRTNTPPAVWSNGSHSTTNSPTLRSAARHPTIRRAPLSPATHLPQGKCHHHRQRTACPLPSRRPYPHPLLPIMPTPLIPRSRSPLSLPEATPCRRRRHHHNSVIIRNPSRPLRSTANRPITHNRRSILMPMQRHCRHRSSTQLVLLHHHHPSPVLTLPSRIPPSRPSHRLPRGHMPHRPPDMTTTILSRRRRLRRPHEAHITLRHRDWIGLLGFPPVHRRSLSNLHPTSPAAHTRANGPTSAEGTGTGTEGVTKMPPKAPPTAQNDSRTDSRTGSRVENRTGRRSGRRNDCRIAGHIWMKSHHLRQTRDSKRPLR